MEANKNNKRPLKKSGSTILNKFQVSGKRFFKLPL